jgi:SNF2 family DNA or RNA helicase
LVAEHKLVVFSQWETMAFEAAKVLDRLGVGYVVLHGGLPGKDRKAVAENGSRTIRRARCSSAPTPAEPG